MRPMAESMKRRLERAEGERSAPWAVRSSEGTRRYPIEDQGRAFDYRTAYQRDRDRIVYSRAFRRLRQKAVTGLLPAYEDHRRNRLTHTLEVVQVARTIGRALALNEDLVEAIALAHDVGQPPFGPAGERALDDLMSGRRDGRGGAGLGDLGGFARTIQGLRVVDLLEKRYDHAGLNLSDPVREGIVKCSPASRSALEGEGLRAGRAPLFEAQVVALADRIASTLHDLDDALQAGAVAVDDVERLKAVQALRRKLGRQWRPGASRFMKANAIHRGLTHLLVTGAILASDARLRAWAAKHEIVDNAAFLRARDEAVSGDEIGSSPAARRLLEDLEAFVERRVQRGREADRVEARGRHAVLGLFAAYHADAGLLDDHVLLRYKEIAGVPYFRDLPREAREGEAVRRYRGDPRFARLLADHLAAMTDGYAVAEFGRLHEMGAVPIPSAERLLTEGRP